ncbi:hypothetical protein NKG05_01830 [Oerskovia sp. M15]
MRGLRTAVKWPELLEQQLEAIALATAAEDAEVWVMAPWSPRSPRRSGSWGAVRRTDSAPPE